MFAFLSQGPLAELLAPVKAPHQQLHQAIEEHKHDIAQQLLQEGVYFNAPDSGRGDALPIHTACQAGNQTMIDALLQMGADLTGAKDRYGNSTLHAAAKGGKIETVKFLVAQGVDVSRRNTYRQTAYDVAESHVVRQYLLPLQLRSEPEPAMGSLASVHNPDVIRDYSNLPPPPTAMSYSAQAPPLPQGMQPQQQQQQPQQGQRKAPVFDRPIAADGFHCSVGNAELEAKYGHVKKDIQMAPPPVSGSGLPQDPQQQQQQQQQQQHQRATANPTQYSAFAAYGGRPPPRYVTYNATDNTSAPFIPSSAPPPPPPPMQQQHQYQQPFQHRQPFEQQHQQQQQQPGVYMSNANGTNASPVPSSPPNHSAPSTSGNAPSPSSIAHSSSASPSLPSPTPGGYRNSPLSSPPPPPPSLPALQPPKLPSSMQFHQQQQQQQQLQQPSTRLVCNIPTLPPANVVNVFTPMADNGEDCVSLDG